LAHEGKIKVSKRKRDAIAEWIERQEHIYVPPRNPFRFYPPFKISRPGTIGSIIMGTLILVVGDTYFILSMISSQNPDWFGCILGGIVVNGLAIPLIIHQVVVLRRLSREDKRG
jgi:hypothetical protein